MKSHFLLQYEKKPDEIADDFIRLFFVCTAKIEPQCKIPSINHKRDLY